MVVDYYNRKFLWMNGEYNFIAFVYTTVGVIKEVKLFCWLDYDFCG